MKQNSQVWIIVLVILIGIIVGFLMKENGQTSTNISRETSINNDPYKELRSDGKYTDEENTIKTTVDKYMFENFGSIFKTTWFDSVSASGAVINEYGRFFVVQSDGDIEEAKKFVEGLLHFFNDKTINKEYHVDKVLIINSQNVIIYEVNTIKW